MFIRGPFIVESLLYSVVATIITIVIFFPATIWVTKKTVFFFEGLNINALYTAHIFELTAVLLLFSAVLTVISSLLAVRKYLMV